jgi:cell division protein FtsN
MYSRGSPGTLPQIPVLPCNLYEENAVETLRALFLLTAGVLVACNTQEADWAKADAQGTVTAYHEFLKHNPDSAHTELARSRILSLEDAQAWTAAQSVNSPEAFEQYLQKEMSGVHSVDARNRINAFARDAAWKLSEPVAAQPVLQDYLVRYPQGLEAQQAHVQLEKLNAEQYRVQLAAFREKSEAERIRARLQTRYAKLLHQVVVVSSSPADKLNRVSSAPMSLEEAQSACATLEKARQHCEVTRV